jgi:hypothetical protein
VVNLVSWESPVNDEERDSVLVILLAIDPNATALATIIAASPSTVAGENSAAGIVLDKLQHPPPRDHFG